MWARRGGVSPAVQRLSGWQLSSGSRPWALRGSRERAPARALPARVVQPGRRADARALLVAAELGQAVPVARSRPPLAWGETVCLTRAPLRRVVSGPCLPSVRCSVVVAQPSSGSGCCHRRRRP